MHQVVLVQKATHNHVASWKGLVGKLRLVLSCLLKDSEATNRKTPVPPLSYKRHQFLLDVLEETFRALMMFCLVSERTGSIGQIRKGVISTPAVESTRRYIDSLCCLSKGEFLVLHLLLHKRENKGLLAKGITASRYASNLLGDSRVTLSAFVVDHG